MSGTPVRPNRLAGYDADTLARMAASDENLRGIVAGRRRAARALIPESRQPAQEVADNTAALLPGDVPRPPAN